MPAEAIVEETETTDDAFYSAPDEGSEEAVDAGETASVDEVEAANPTALLPTSSLGSNPKVGDVVSLKVVKIHDEEVEVEITSGKAKSDEPKSANTELDAMAGESDSDY